MRTRERCESDEEVVDEDGDAVESSRSGLISTFTNGFGASSVGGGGGDDERRSQKKRSVEVVRKIQHREAAPSNHIHHRLHLSSPSSVACMKRCSMRTVIVLVLGALLVVASAGIFTRWGMLVSSRLQYDGDNVLVSDEREAALRHGGATEEGKAIELSLAPDRSSSVAEEKNEEVQQQRQKEEGAGGEGEEEEIMETLRQTLAELRQRTKADEKNSQLTMDEHKVNIAFPPVRFLFFLLLHLPQRFLPFCLSCCPSVKLHRRRSSFFFVFCFFSPSSRLPFRLYCRF